MTEQFSTGLAGRVLAVALDTTDTRMTLANVPEDLKPGTYRFRDGAEIWTGVYPGTGTSFVRLERGVEASTPARHRQFAPVQHVITGGSLDALRAEARPAAFAGPDPALYARSVGARLALASLA